MQAVLRHCNFEIVKCVLIASPGFVKEQFFDYMFQSAVKNDNKMLLDNKGKFLLVHASSGFKHSLRGSLTKSIALLICCKRIQQLSYGIKLFHSLLLLDFLLKYECKYV